MPGVAYESVSVCIVKICSMPTVCTVTKHYPINPAVAVYRDNHDVDYSHWWEASITKLGDIYDLGIPNHQSLLQLELCSPCRRV